MSAWAVALVIVAGWAGWAGWEAGLRAGRRDVMLAVEAVDRDWRRNFALIRAVQGKLQGMGRPKGGVR